MKYIKSLYKFLKDLFRRANKDSVAAYSGHSALFVVISAFPLVMLLLTALKHTALSEGYLLNLLKDSTNPLAIIISESIDDIFGRLGNIAISLTALTLLWSASSCIYSITMGLNKVYNYKETRNYFLLRGISVIYTLLFIILLMATLVLMVFGGGIIRTLQTYFPVIKRFSSVIHFCRQVLGFLIILVISDLFYTFIPNHKSKPLYEFPGAAVTAVCWYVFSYLYTIYVGYFSKISYLYGGLATAIFLLLWLYFCMYIFFLGAEINQMAAEAGWCYKKKQKLNKKQPDS